MSERYDVIVVGVGTFGAAACAELARRGARVLGLDRYGTPNELGAHDAGPRVFRLAYYEHPDYVPLLKRSHELWQSWNKEGEEKVFHQVGALFVGPVDCPLIADSARAAGEHDVPVEMLTRAELAERYPWIRTDEGWVGLFEPTAGLVLAREAVTRFADEAQWRGAVLRTGHVTEIITEKNGVRVITEAGSYTADRCVVSAGAWVRETVPAFKRIVTVTRQIVGWCSVADGRHREMGDTPCWATQEADGNLFYGFPILPGADEMKIAIHGPGEAVDVEHAPRDPRPQDAQDLRRLLAMRIADDRATLDRTEVCLYARSPDGHFIIDRCPDNPRIVVACGFSGHGFKFAPVVGEALADLALNGSSDLPIGFLGMGRLRNST
jgi:sarcosine oxidase